MTGWQEDKRWSDRFLIQIKRILGELFIGEANEEEDQKHNTDLIVLCIESIRVGCRVRKAYYLDKWPNDFTIRCARPSGTPTELEKMLDGWGDYFFYGFADEQEKNITAWRVITLERLRAYIAWYLKTNGTMPGLVQENRDSSSSFRSFNSSDRYVRATVFREGGFCPFCGGGLLDTEAAMCETCAIAEEGWNSYASPGVYKKREV